MPDAVSQGEQLPPLAAIGLFWRRQDHDVFQQWTLYDQWYACPPVDGPCREKEVRAEVEQQPQLVVAGLDPVQLGFDHLRVVVHAEGADGAHPDDAGGQILDGLDHGDGG